MNFKCVYRLLTILKKHISKEHIFVIKGCEIYIYNGKGVKMYKEHMNENYCKFQASLNIILSNDLSTFYLDSCN